MNDAPILEVPMTAQPQDRRVGEKVAAPLTEHVIEIISDSGEGAQRCGQSLGAIAARSGNGVWTVEIIPAEIQPPARSIAGASGNRVRIGSKPVTNGGDEADLVVAFNEQVLLGRVRAKELKPGCIILLESMWREDRDPKVAASYAIVLEQLIAEGYRVHEVPMEHECRQLTTDPRRGKNMFALGMLCSIYSLDLQLARDQVALTFRKKDEKIIQANVALLEAGYQFAENHLDLKFHVPAVRATDRAGAWCARVGYGNLRDVSDHAGHVDLALPVRGIREGRWHRASGRG